MATRIVGFTVAPFVGISLISESGQTRAAQVAQVAQVAPQAAPHLISKQILGETSIDGPGLAKNIIGHEGDHTLVLAWADTDAQHHLNLLTNTTGATWINKRTLSDTSFVRPAVERVPDMAGGEVVLAWTGTDARHTLNVLWNAYNNGNSAMKKVTFWGDMSLPRPCLRCRVTASMWPGQGPTRTTRSIS